MLIYVCLLFLILINLVISELYLKFWIKKDGSLAIITDGNIVLNNKIRCVDKNALECSGLLLKTIRFDLRNVNEKTSLLVKNSNIVEFAKKIQFLNDSVIKCSQLIIDGYSFVTSIDDGDNRDRYLYGLSPLTKTFCPIKHGNRYRKKDIFNQLQRDKKIATINNVFETDLFCSLDCNSDAKLSLLELSDFKDNEKKIICHKNVVSLQKKWEDFKANSLVIFDSYLKVKTDKETLFFHEDVFNLYKTGFLSLRGREIRVKDLKTITYNKENQPLKNSIVMFDINGEFKNCLTFDPNLDSGFLQIDKTGINLIAIQSDEFKTSLTYNGSSSDISLLTVNSVTKNSSTSELKINFANVLPSEEYFLVVDEQNKITAIPRCEFAIIKSNTTDNKNNFLYFEKNGQNTINSSSIKIDFNEVKKNDLFVYEKDTIKAKQLDLTHLLQIDSTIDKTFDGHMPYVEKTINNTFILKPSSIHYDSTQSTFVIPPSRLVMKQLKIDLTRNATDIKTGDCLLFDKNSFKFQSFLPEKRKSGFCLGLNNQKQLEFMPLKKFCTTKTFTSNVKTEIKNIFQSVLIAENLNFEDAQSIECTYTTGAALVSTAFSSIPIEFRIAYKTKFDEMSYSSVFKASATIKGQNFKLWITPTIYFTEKVSEPQNITKIFLQARYNDQLTCFVNVDRADYTDLKTFPNIHSRMTINIC